MQSRRLPRRESVGLMMRQEEQQDMSRAFLEISCRGCITPANGPALAWPQPAARGSSSCGGGGGWNQDLRVVLILVAVL